MKRWFLLFLVAACGDNESRPDTAVPIDAAPDAPPDAPPQMGTVTATATVHHLTEAGEVTAPAMNLQLVDSTNAVILPVTNANGTLRFSPVAPGPYLICDVSQINRPICTQASGAMIDLDYHLAGRPDATLGLVNSQLTLTVTGATGAPAGNNEFFDIRVINTNFFDYPSSPVTPPLVANHDFNGHGLLIPADVVRVTQLVTKMSGTDEYVAAARTGSVTGITMTSGQTTAAAVNLGTALPQTSNVSFTLQRSQFNALSGSPGPAPTFLGCEINGFSEPRPFPFASWVFWFPRPDALTTDKALTFSYGSSAPSTNTETFEVACSHQVDATAPGATGTYGIIVYTATYRPMTELSGNIAPVLSRATALRVNGMDASVSQTATTQTPTISWTAPTMGTATRYTLFVYKLLNSSGSTFGSVVGQFSTTGTSFRIPAGFINAGQAYAVTVRAQAIPGYDPAKPFATVLRYELADAVTAVLQP